MKICCDTGKEIKTDMDRLGCGHDRCTGAKEMIEEPIGVLCGKIPVVEKHIPYYLQDSSHSHKYHWEAFEDRNGNKADLKVVGWVTKKGKDREAVIVVKWR